MKWGHCDLDLQFQVEISNFILSDAEHYCLKAYTLNVLWLNGVSHIKWGQCDLDLQFQVEISNFIFSSVELFCLKAYTLDTLQARSNPYAKTQLRTHRKFWQKWKHGKSRT